MNPPKDAHSKLKVLLIDDSEDDAIIAQAMLSRVRGAEFEDEWVSTFDDGVNKLKQNAHDICLLDYCLGPQTGLDVLREASAFGCRVPIIILTGTNNQDIDLQAIKLGAADYVVKGETNPALLERAIRHARERKKAAAERDLLNQQLIESSRLAGMGEVASNILHNVGNVLNSINVSVGLLSQYLQEMPIADVGRVAHLLEDHQDEVGEFLTCHPKGKRIPSFLTQLGGHLALHFDSAKNELETLMPQLERVNQILATQKDFAAANAVLEPVVLVSMIEQALLINQPGLEKYHIAVKLKLSDVPKIVVDRYQVFQILINLIRNAKEAMQVQCGAPHRLTVELTRPADHQEVVRIQVSDTGIGISPEHLTRIFAPKFTSSNQRQGLGLHGSALAAKNMGGALRAWSAGEGHGATFTLDLPMRTFEDSASPTESLPTFPHTE